MAVKFKLEMKDGVMVRNIKELKEYFDINKVVSLFLNGKLLVWLDSRDFEEERDAVSELNEADPELAKKLCDIFGVEYVPTEVIDTKKVIEQNERLLRLKQYTDDENILNNVDCVAFNQEELEKIYNTEATKIYLCAGEFNIPKSKQDIEYVELGNAVVIGKYVNCNADNRFEVRTEFVLDPLYSSGLLTNQDGVSYNKIKNSIFIVNSKQEDEIIIAENVFQWICDKTKIIYTIYDTNIQHSKIIMYDMNKGMIELAICIDFFSNFICFDEKKVIWEERGGLHYVKYFTDDNRKLIFSPQKNDGYCNIREGCICNDLYIYRNGWGTLFCKNLITENEKTIHGQISNTQLKKYDDFLWFAGEYGKKIYRLNLNDLSLEDFCSTENSRGIHTLEILEDVIIWIGEYELGYYKLYVLNRMNNEKRLLDFWNGDIRQLSAYMYIDSGWIYYTYVHNLTKKEYITRKIKLDGTEKTVLFNRQEIVNRVLEKQGFLTSKNVK